MNITAASSQTPLGKSPHSAASLAGALPGGAAAAPGPVVQQTGVGAALAAGGLAEVQKAANRAQEMLGRTASSLKFAVDDATGTVVVKVVDTETEQVIRQIPSEEMLAIARNMEQLKGLLLKREA